MCIGYLLTVSVQDATKSPIRAAIIFLYERVLDFLWSLGNKDLQRIKQRIYYYGRSHFVNLLRNDSKPNNILYEYSYKYLRKRAGSEPVTFNEKILFRMAFDRNPVFSLVSDKLAVRKYVKDRVGESFLIPTLAIAASPLEIEWESLPNNFVCKVTHGSGGLIGVYERVEKEVLLPNNFDSLKWQRYWVNPEKFSQISASGMLSKWMSMNYEWQPGRSPEWAYKNIKPFIIVEKLLTNNQSKIALQTQLYVFDGQVKLIRKAGRKPDGTRTMTYFTPAWEHIPVTFSDSRKSLETDGPTQKPRLLADLISVAEALAKDLDFARVDLFDLGEEIKFGEITIYPSAGEGFWSPRNFSAELGTHWNLDLLMKEKIND